MEGSCPLDHFNKHFPASNVHPLMTLNLSTTMTPYTMEYIFSTQRPYNHPRPSHSLLQTHHRLICGLPSLSLHLINNPQSHAPRPLTHLFSIRFQSAMPSTQLAHTAPHPFRTYSQSLPPASKGSNSAFPISSPLPPSAEEPL